MKLDNTENSLTYLNLATVKKVYVLEGTKSKVWVEIYEDDPNTGIISHLMVDQKHRKNGIGHKTLFDAEQFLKHKGVNTILLMCENGSWVFNWYIREGYSFHSNEDHKYVWLVKTK